MRHPLLPSSHLPHLNGLVSGGRHYVVTVWHDGNRRHIVVMAWVTKSRVKFHRCSETIFALWKYQKRVTVVVSSLVLTMHCSDALKSLKIPQFDAHVGWTWSQQFSCLVKADVLHRVCVALQGSLKVSCLVVPHLQSHADSNNQSGRHLSLHHYQAEEDTFPKIEVWLWNMTGWTEKYHEKLIFCLS